MKKLIKTQVENVFIFQPSININSHISSFKFVEYCKKGNNVAVAIDEKVRPNDFVYKLIKRDFIE